MAADEVVVVVASIILSLVLTATHRCRSFCQMAHRFTVEVSTPGVFVV